MNVWITGASSGIGKALTEVFASHGHHVIATARSAEKLEAMAARHDNIYPLPADLTASEDLRDLEKYFSETQMLDLVIVNAGTCEYLDEGIKLDTARHVMELNYFAAIETVRIALPALEKSANAQIAMVLSMTTFLPFTRAEYYGASKAALEYFTKSLRIDLKPLNISVTEIYPGFVETPLTENNNFPMPFLLSSEKAADIIVKGLARNRRRIAMPWQMNILLRILGWFPTLWNTLHKTGVQQGRGLS